MIWLTTTYYFFDRSLMSLQGNDSFVKLIKVHAAFKSRPRTLAQPCV